MGFKHAQFGNFAFRRRAVGRKRLAWSKVVEPKMP